MGNRFKNIFKASRDKESLGSKFRHLRMQYFLKLIEPLQKPLKILDVGGTEYLWEQIGLKEDMNYSITLLNLSRQNVTGKNFKSIAGDATDLSNFKDNTFDIVFSNSVIEHLYTKDNQKKMSKEVMRVGKYYFIQTPNKYFFLEPHYLLPFIHFFSKSIQYFILTRTKLSRLRKWNPDLAKRYTDEIRLISHNEIKKMFLGSFVWKEKFLGFNKSFIAHNFDTKN